MLFPQSSLLKSAPLLLVAICCLGSDHAHEAQLRAQQLRNELTTQTTSAQLTTPLNFRRCEDCVCTEGCLTCNGTGRVYVGNPDIAPEHRTAPVVLAIGMPGKGKSTLCNLLTGADKTSDKHILRMHNRADPLQAGARAPHNIELFHNDASDCGHVTSVTSVVETHLLKPWGPDSDDQEWTVVQEATPLVIVDTPGIGNVTSLMNPDEATTFQANIMESTLHINNSYGGVNRFIICERADDPRRDDNGMHCITHLAAAFGGEIDFMQNLSIVFTHSDRILNLESSDDRRREIQSVINNFESALYRVSGVAKLSGFRLVHGVDRDLQPTDIPCYFIDSKQAMTLLTDKTQAMESEVENLCQEQRVLFDEINTDLEQHMQTMFAGGWTDSRGDFDATSTLSPRTKKYLRAHHHQKRTMLQSARKSMENAYRFIRQRVDFRNGDLTESAERSRHNIRACMELIRRSPKKTLKVQCFETLAAAAKRHTEQTSERLTRAEIRVANAQLQQQHINIELQQAMLARDSEAQERAKTARLLVEQQLLQAQADLTRQLAEFTDAAERETFWSRAGWWVGTGVGGKVIIGATYAAVGTAAMVTWPVTLAVAAGAGVATTVVGAVGAVRTPDAQQRLEANDGYTTARARLDNVNSTLARDFGRRSD